MVCGLGTGAPLVWSVQMAIANHVQSRYFISPTNLSQILEGHFSLLCSNKASNSLSTPCIRDYIAGSSIWCLLPLTGVEKMWGVSREDAWKTKTTLHSSQTLLTSWQEGTGRGSGVPSLCYSFWIIWLTFTSLPCLDTSSRLSESWIPVNCSYIMMNTNCYRTK